MRVWIDDIRPAPDHTWWWCRSVYEAKSVISKFRWGRIDIEVISIDYDAGDFYEDGGDYIKVLDWLEEKGWSYPIHIHSMNSVGRQNMKRIIKRNGWKEILNV